VFYGASIYYLIQKLVAALLVAPPSTPLVNQFTLPYFAGMLLATAFFAAPMSVAMTRNALGNLESRAGVYFIYGAREIRALWAFVKLYAIAVALTLGTGVLSVKAAAMIAAQIAPAQLWLGTQPIVWLTGGAAFITVCMFVFIEARLGFFLAPLAASRERPLLRYSWQLGRGNSWAVFAATFAMLLTVLGALGACYYFFSDSNFNATMIAQRGDPAMWHAIANSAMPIAAICAITLTVFSGLFAGASAHAYGVVSGNLERVEVEDAPTYEEPVHAMAASARPELGFAFRTVGEPFVARDIPHEAPQIEPHPLNAVSEPTAAEAPPAAAVVVEEVPPAEMPAEEPSAEEQPAEEAILPLEELAPAENADATPPPAVSEAPPVSPETAPLEVV
jgi:hypothetical protein